MELLSIISAVKSCPNGAYVDIYTDSQYCVLVLSKSYSPDKNADFYDLYRECSSHLAEVRFHWIESQNKDKYNKQVHKLCTEAYWNTCEQHGIEKFQEYK